MEHHFNTNIAKKYGIEEAIILHHFYYWIAKNAANRCNFHDGLFWTYNSRKVFCTFFGYMSETKIFRVIRHLEEKGLIVKSNFNESKMNRTNWYAITIDGLKYLKENDYDTDIFSASLQNDTLHCVKMNNGLCQNEQCDKYNTKYNTLNIEKENIKEREKKKNGVELPDYITPEYRDVMTEWLEYKKERRETYKSRGLKQCYDKLIKYSNGNPDVALEIIHTAMANNYTGFFPLRNTPQQAKLTPYEQQQLERQRYTVQFEQRIFDNISSLDDNEGAGCGRLPDDI